MKESNKCHVQMCKGGLRSRVDIILKMLYISIVLCKPELTSFLKSNAIVIYHAVHTRGLTDGSEVVNVCQSVSEVSCPRTQSTLHELELELLTFDQWANPTN